MIREPGERYKYISTHVNVNVNVNNIFISFISKNSIINNYIENIKRNYGYNTWFSTYYELITCLLGKDKIKKNTNRRNLIFEQIGDNNNKNNLITSANS